MAAWLVVGIFMALALESSALSAPSTTPQSWFDAPLPASQHPLGPIAVTTHSTAPGGISAVELFVDGTSFATQDFAGAPRLVTAAFNWQPTEERAYWLVVRGRSGELWGPTASILVIIGTLPASPSQTPSPNSSVTASPTPTPSPTAGPTAPPTPSPTPRRTASPTPRVTPSPTPTKTPKPTATPTPCTTPLAPSLRTPADYFLVDDPAFNPPTFEWRYPSTTDCPASGFVIQVATSADFSDLVATGEVGANTRQWTPGDQLPDCNADIAYSWRVFAKGDGRTFGPPSATRHFAVYTFACDG